LSRNTGDVCKNESVMRVVVCVWLALLTALSLAPLRIKWQLGTTGALHDAGHLSIFAATAFLVCWTAKGVSGRLIRFAGVGAIALVLEGMESALYHNRLEWHDILMDLCGAAAGLAILSVLPITSSAKTNSVQR